jgi:hypothetical protein
VVPPPLPGLRLPSHDSIESDATESFLRCFPGQVDENIAHAKEVARGKLAIIGTGFYVARYGLFLTARHVLEALVDWKTQGVGAGYVCHRQDERSVHLRRILRISLLQLANLAIGQADNFLGQHPDAPLMNLRAALTIEVFIVGGLHRGRETHTEHELARIEASRWGIDYMRLPSVPNGLPSGPSPGLSYARLLRLLTGS